MKIQVQHVQQPTPHTCAHACLSMVTGIPVADLIDRFGNHGIGDEEKATVLCEMGILPVSIQQMAGIEHPLPYPGAYILDVPSLNLSGRGHSVVCAIVGDNWQIFDPNEGRDGRLFYSRNGLETGELRHYVAHLLIPLRLHAGTERRLALYAARSEGSES